MSAQQSLPFQRHSATSKAAAIQAQSTAGTARAAVLLVIKQQGPMTDEQIQVALQMNPSTQRPRRIELVRAGLVEKVGRGVTKSGRSADTWGLVTT